MLCLRWIEPYSCCLLWITFFYMLEPTWLLVINNWSCNLFHIGRSVLRQNTVWVPKLSLGKKSNIQCFFVICYHLMNFEITYSWLVVSKYKAFKLRCFVLILHKLLYNLGKNILRTPCFILVLFHCVFCFFMSIRNEKKFFCRKMMHMTGQI